METLEIKVADAKEDFLKCWEVVRELRPHLNQDRYLTLMLYMLDEGYKLIYIEEEDQVIAFCGYRHVTMLHRGRSIYIDDLCTLEAFRGRGYGSRLLDHVLAEAREEECQSVHLDSGYQRHDAHRLYLEKGFRMSAHHLAITDFSDHG
jgi:GNAT superfamily N-acetyltransferase